MTTEELTQEPHERLVEVLLEEEFRGSRAVHAAPTGRVASRWLAAAVVLLGLGVVVGVMTMRGSGEVDPVPVQDPKPAPKEPESIVLKTHAEFLALTKDVLRIRMEAAKSWEPTFDAANNRFVGDFIGLDDGVATLEEPTQVQHFVASIPKLADGIHGFRMIPGVAPVRITLELRDGRAIRGGAFFGNQSGFWLSVLGPAFPPPAPLLEALNGLHEQTLANYRIAHGITESFAELARVPATAKSILCLPLPPGTVAKYLGRFAQLERLDLAITTTLSGGPKEIYIPTPVRLAEYAALPNLRHLRFPGAGLRDADADALAHMQNLTSIRIDGGLVNLRSQGLGVLFTNLEAIELVSVDNGNAVVRAAIAAGKLRKVALFGVELTPDEFAALVAMPTLRHLDLTGIWWQDSHLAQLLAAKTPLERLRLRSTKITPAGLQTLTALPTLHELDLRQAGLRTPAIDALEKALPNCRIRRPGEPNDDPMSLDDLPGRTRR